MTLLAHWFRFLLPPFQTNELCIFFKMKRISQIRPALHFLSNTSSSQGAQGRPKFWDRASSSHHTTKNICFVIDMHS